MQQPRDALPSHPVSLTATNISEGAAELLFLSQQYQPRQMLDILNGNYRVSKRMFAGLLGAQLFSLFPKGLQVKIVEYTKLPDKNTPYTINKRIGFGSQFAVYSMVDSKNTDTDLVLKCLKPVADAAVASAQVHFETALERSDFHNKAKLLETAQTLQEEYEFIQGLYHELEVLVPEAYFIGIDPIYRRETVCLIAPQLQVKQDILRMTNAELQQLSGPVRQKLQQFARITLEYINNQGILPDLLNPNNLVLVEDQTGEFDVKLIDPHVVFEIEKLGSIELARLQELTKQLEALTKL